MFGTFRLVLAMMVVFTHIGRVEIVAGVAVWGFFMLSGFLMTAVLNTKYGFNGTGIGRFALSRATRLYPGYWLSVLLTAIVMHAFAAQVDARLINPVLAVPQTAREIFSNVFILGHTWLGLGRIERALSPSAWAVDVEMLMYICSCLFLARGAATARLTTFVLVAVFPVLWYLSKQLLAQGQPEYSNQVTYSFLPAALLPYAIGSSLWHARDAFKSMHWSRRPLTGGIAVAGIVVCCFLISCFSVTVSYLGSLVFLALLLVNLSQVKAKPAMARIDEFAGWMSYPVYLLHFMCAYIVAVATRGASSLHFFDGQLIRFTPAGFFAVLCVTLAVSAMFAMLVEAPLERWRRRSISYGRQSRNREDGASSVS